MAITAHFEPAVPGKARAPRRTLRLEAAGALPSGETAQVLVHNVSRTGLLLECAGSLGAGEILMVELPHAGPVEARVVWSSGALHGCQFAAPLSPATLSAAELRSAAGSGLANDSPAGEGIAGEPFGARLQRLRKARKLTLGQIADSLGVSKPTVWAWEHDKARPLESRLEALAALLDVRPEDLDAGRSDDPRRDAVARARADIAAAYHTDYARVRIMIEL